MLENVQIIKEKNKPKFAVIGFEEYCELKNFLSDERKLEDYLDYVHLQQAKKRTKKTYTLLEVKEKLKIS